MHLLQRHSLQAKFFFRADDGLERSNFRRDGCFKLCKGTSDQMEIQEPAVAVAVVQEPGVSVVIVDSHGYRIGESFGEEQVLTMVALVSEDPVCWEDMEAAWPRYRTPAVPEFISGLMIEKVDRTVAVALLNSGASWIVIDLVQKRIRTGPDCPVVEGMQNCR